MQRTVPWGERRPFAPQPAVRLLPPMVGAAQGCAVGVARVQRSGVARATPQQEEPLNVLRKSAVARAVVGAIVAGAATL
ncbi:MAG: hypothetical protein ABL982_20615, partial [Vicinamibacterales bacterium]